MKSIGCLLASAVLAAGGLGCGGDEPGRTAGSNAVAVETSSPGTGGEGARAPAAPRSGAAARGNATRAPKLERVSLSPDPPSPGQVVRALVKVDGDGGYDLQYTWEIANRRLDDAPASITLPELRKGDRVRVHVVATNAAGSSRSVSAEATIANEPPKLLDLRLQEKTNDQGKLEAWEAVAWAQDPDGDPIEYEYRWILNDRPSPIRESAYPISELSRGDRLRVIVLASDGEDEAPSVESGTLEVANTAPEIVSTPPGLDPSGSYSYTIEAEDADGDRSLRFELVSGPRGMEMNAVSGELTWKPEVDQAGRHVVEIAVDDLHGGRTSQEFLIPVVALESYGDDEEPASIP